MNQKVDIEIARRRMTIELEGLTPLEIQALAQQVQERINEAAVRFPHIVDTQKLAILAALDMADDLNRLKDESALERSILENKIQEFSTALRGALAHARK